VEWLEPTALDTAVKCVWSRNAEAAVGVRGGDSCVAPRTLSFAGAVRIVNPLYTAGGPTPTEQRWVGMHQRDGVQESDSDRIHKRPRYGGPQASAYAGPNVGIIAGQKNEGLSNHHAHETAAPMRSELTALLLQQQQIEAAIMRLTPEQVAGLSDEHSTMYWRLKRERHCDK
jgi:hypothetical protein